MAQRLLSGCRVMFRTAAFNAQAPMAPSAHGSGLACQQRWPTPGFFQTAAFASAVKAPKANPKSAAKKEAAGPEPPKRPTSAWLRFLRDFRERQSVVEVSLGPKEVMSAASVEWKALSEEKKRPYEKAYEADKKAYAEEKKAFDESDAGAARAKRDPARPKAPSTSFLLFVQDFRSKAGSELKVTEAVTKAAEAWKSMSEAERAPFEQKYATAKEEYAKEFKEYKDSGKEKEWKVKKAMFEKPTGQSLVEKKALKKKLAAEAKVEVEKQKLEKVKQEIAALKAK